jgi:glycosyltransferase involved in cell wall biosynthesis
VLEEVLRAASEPPVLLSPERPDTQGWIDRGFSALDAAEYDWLAADAARVSEVSAELDLLFSLVTDVPPRSRARRSVAHVQFPHRSHTGLRARVLGALGLRRATAALASYDLFTCPSDFSREWIERRLGVADAVVLPGPVDVPARDFLAKDPVILSVGRFFRGGHSKNQHVLVEAFRELAEPGWELHLVGGADESRSTADYLAEIARAAEGQNVRLHVNVPAKERDDLYARASLFWHAAGFGQDSNRHPERLEHFGLATAEAMARGAVPLVFPAGGQVEIVEGGRNGRHWRTPAELAARSRELIEDAHARENLAAHARRDAERYGRDRFAAAVRRHVLGL